MVFAADLSVKLTFCVTVRWMGSLSWGEVVMIEMPSDRLRGGGEGKSYRERHASVPK
jgi:hypothetical protein